MEIYQIKSLDCTKGKNRRTLALEVATLLGKDSPLTSEQIQKATEKISKKYGYKIQQIQYSVENKDLCWVSFDTGNGYAIYRANSKYEIAAKFILLVNEYRKHKKKVDEFK